MHLYQACGRVSEPARERMVIILDGSKFKFGSEEYIQKQNVEIGDFELSDDLQNDSFVLRAKTKVS